MHQRPAMAAASTASPARPTGALRACMPRSVAVQRRPHLQLQQQQAGLLQVGGAIGRRAAAADGERCAVPLPHPAHPPPPPAHTAQAARRQRSQQQPRKYCTGGAPRVVAASVSGAAVNAAAVADSGGGGKALKVTSYIGLW